MLSSCYYAPDWESVERLYDKVTLSKEEMRVRAEQNVAAENDAAARQDRQQPPQPMASPAAMAAVPAPQMPPKAMAPRAHPAAPAMAPAPMTKESSAAPKETRAMAAPMPLAPAAPAPAPMHTPGHNPEMNAAPAGDAFALHLGSYRKMSSLKAHWRQLVTQYPEFLTGLRVRISKFEKGRDTGTLLRLKAGPLPDRNLAARLCRSLKSRGAYCGILKFTGAGLS